MLGTGRVRKKNMMSGIRRTVSNIKRREPDVQQAKLDIGNHFVILKMAAQPNEATATNQSN